METGTRHSYGGWSGEFLEFIVRAGAKGEQAPRAATTRVVRARAKSNQNCRIALNLITLCLSAKPEMETSIIPVVTANTFISFEPALACLSGEMTR